GPHRRTRLPVVAAARPAPRRRRHGRLGARAGDPRGVVRAGGRRMKWVAIGLLAIIAVAVGAWWYEQYKADSTLLKQPVYRVLKEHERTLYDELLDEYRVYQRGEEGPEKFINLANSQISLAATQRLAHAS